MISFISVLLLTITGIMPPGKRGRRARGTANTSRYLASGLLGINCEPDDEEESESEEDNSSLFRATELSDSSLLSGSAETPVKLHKRET